MAEKFSDDLVYFKERVERALQRAIEKFPASKDLTHALSYTLLNPGKRLRPLLLLAIAQGLLGSKIEKEPYKEMIDEISCCTEMFHCASLIADDLPCMDNDDFRRGMPSLHKKFDEATAILSTYCLISEGYLAVYRAAESLKNSGCRDAQERGLLAVECIARNAGIDGAALGQHMDLKLKNPTLNQLEELLFKKTATLFEISLVLGFLFGSGNLKQLSTVKSLAFDLGMAFQILDDVEDYTQKGEKSDVNYALALGLDKAKEKAVNYLNSSKQHLKDLSLETPLLFSIIGLLENKVAAR